MSSANSSHPGVCSICKDYQPTGYPHTCPLTEVVETNRLTSLDQWPVVAEPPLDRVYLRLFVKAKVDSDARSFDDISGDRDAFDHAILGDRVRKWANDGQQITPPACDNYLIYNTSEIIISDAQKAELLEACRRRVELSTVFGHTSREWNDSVEDREAYRKFLTFSLFRSTLLENKLRETSERYRRGDFELTLTTGAMNVHDTTTSAIALFGPTATLQQIAAGFNKEAVSAANGGRQIPADALLAVPLAGLVEKKTTEEVVSYLASLYQGPTIEAPKKEIKFHIKASVLNLLKERFDHSTIPAAEKPFFFLHKELFKDTDLALLVVVKIYPEACVFDIAGGKIELPETPLECATRELLWDTGIDLRAPYNAVGFRGHPEDGSEGESSKDWKIMFHYQKEETCYYALHKDNREQYLQHFEDAAKKLPAADTIFRKYRAPSGGASGGATGTAGGGASSPYKAPTGQRSNWSNDWRRGASAAATGAAPGDAQAAAAPAVPKTYIKPVTVTDGDGWSTTVQKTITATTKPKYTAPSPATGFAATPSAGSGISSVPGGPCTYFFRFGKCDYGEKCHFSHAEKDRPAPGSFSGAKKPTGAR